jgi:hypothetical protein
MNAIDVIPGQYLRNDGRCEPQGFFLDGTRHLWTLTLNGQRHFAVFSCVLQAHQPQCASTRFRDKRLGKPDASAFRLIKSGAVQLVPGAEVERP